MIEATGELQAPRQDVWGLIAEPYHLPDWWPAYQGVRPDHRGFAEGARWHIVRNPAPGLLQRPGGEGLIVVTRIVEGYEFRWVDLAQRVEARIALDNAGTGRTRAWISVSGPWWRLLLEGTRSHPRRALVRLEALCQTAASL
jgi:uncharacterized protein YndB with AHSA1/START domain